MVAKTIRRWKSDWYVFRPSAVNLAGASPGFVLGSVEDGGCRRLPGGSSIIAKEDTSARRNSCHPRLNNTKLDAEVK